MLNRLCFQPVETRLWEPRKWIQVILGPRQVGKTTGLRQISKRFESEGKRVIYLSADEPTLKDSAWLDREWNRARTSSTSLLIIDEIQKISQWSETVKRLWDEDSFNEQNLRVCLLGSSSLLLNAGLTESLAGRFEVHFIPHWTFLEMKKEFDFSLREWIHFGGYPGPADIRNTEDRWKEYVRNSLIEATLSRDIFQMNSIEKPALLRRLFELGASETGQIVSFQKILGHLQDKGNATTLSNYATILDQASLLKGIPKFSGSEIRKKASIPKWNVYNNALTSALDARLLSKAEQETDYWGRKVESAVGVYFLAHQESHHLQINYWRERNFEVDFVITYKGKVAAFEVKSSMKKTNFSGLKTFHERYPKSHSWVVGGPTGIPLEEFFSSPIEHWF